MYAYMRWHRKNQMCAGDEVACEVWNPLPNAQESTGPRWTPYFFKTVAWHGMDVACLSAISAAEREKRFEKAPTWGSLRETLPLCQFRQSRCNTRPEWEWASKPDQVENSNRCKITLNDICIFEAGTSKKGSRLPKCILRMKQNVKLPIGVLVPVGKLIRKISLKVYWKWLVALTRTLLESFVSYCLAMRRRETNGECENY